MKRLLFFASIVAVGALSSCDEKKDGRINSDIVTNSQSASGTRDVPKSDLRFEKDTFNFGEVLEGEKVVHAFRFKNVGNNDLIISNAVGSCGCTVPTWPKEPIKPGQTGVIHVEFDSEKRAGKADKTITVYANTEPAYRRVYLQGFVKGVPKD